MNKKETDYHRLHLVRSLSHRRKGAVVSLSELGGMNSTTQDPADKAEHNIQKKSKALHSSDVLLHSKPSQAERGETIMAFSSHDLEGKEFRQGSSGEGSPLLHNVWGLD